MLIFQTSTAHTSPSHKRIDAFIEFFEKKGYEISIITFNDSLLKRIRKILQYRKDYIFISMPPFRNFWLFFIPNTKIILDIRDGWSISQERGYGGLSKKRPFRAKVSRLIEGFAIKRSYLTITCTPGLKNYLCNISNSNIILIPNGVNESDLKLMIKMKNQSKNNSSKNEITFCCAGQFSEYGVDKVTLLLETIAKRYSKDQLCVQLIGSDPLSNEWTKSFFDRITKGRGKIELLPRLNKKELFITMLKADYGLTIIRDPDYDFGTKVYDYIALGLPVINYFSKPNNFTKYFDAHLDTSFNKNADKVEFRRSILIESQLKTIIKDIN